MHSESERRILQPEGIHLDPQELYLLRGPFLIGVAILLLGISIAQSLSFASLVQLSLLGIGLAICSYDAYALAHNRLRTQLQQQLGTIVWDDVLYQFWHPDVEWWRWLVDTFLGQAVWMYIFPSTPAQRVQLVQAALGVEEEEAERILLAPGGYKHLLLPRRFVQWLEEDENNRTGESGNNKISLEKNKEQVPEQIMVEMDIVPGASSSSSSPPSPEKDSLSEEGVVVEHPHQETKKGATATGIADKPGDNRPSAKDLPPTMSDTMKSIVLDALSDQLRQCLVYVPPPKQLAGIGIAATTALALQLRCSPRARRIAMTCLETSALAGLSALSVTATTLFLAKTTTINESNLMTYISKVLQLRKSLSEAAASAADNGSDRNNYAKRGLLCLAIALTLLGMRKRRQQATRQHQPPMGTN